MPNDILEDIRAKIESRRETFSCAIIKMALVRKEGEPQFHSARITFLKAGDQAKDLEWDYGCLLLVQKKLSVEAACSFIMNLENGKVDVEGLPRVNVKISTPNKAEFVSSKSHSGWLSPDWPAYYAELGIIEPPVVLPNVLLFSLCNPIYPDGGRAWAEFLGCRPNSSPRNTIFVEIPDFRVRLSDLRITGNRVKAEVEVNGLPCERLRVVFYGERDSKPMRSQVLDVKDGFAEHEFDVKPDYLIAVVMDGETGERLDDRYFYFSWLPSFGKQEGVTLDIDELEVIEVIKRGEGPTVEFKETLNPSEFLETVVAFANTEGGTILLGVSDNARIKGYELQDKDQITDLISGNLEPAVKHSVKKIEINKLPMVVVSIPEGDNKPYSHRERGFYVRSGATDRSATRTDFDEINSKKVRFL